MRNYLRWTVLDEVSLRYFVVWLVCIMYNVMGVRMCVGVRDMGHKNRFNFY